MKLEVSYKNKKLSAVSDQQKLETFNLSLL